jgi:hypothetical protein
MPVRVDPGLRAAVERHRDYLQARQKYTDCPHERISLAEAARDLLARALGRRELRALRAELRRHSKPTQLDLKL